MEDWEGGGREERKEREGGLGDYGWERGQFRRQLACSNHFCTLECHQVEAAPDNIMVRHIIF